MRAEWRRPALHWKNPKVVLRMAQIIHRMFPFYDFDRCIRGWLTYECMCVCFWDSSNRSSNHNMVERRRANRVREKIDTLATVVAVSIP